MMCTLDNVMLLAVCLPFERYEITNGNKYEIMYGRGVEEASGTPRKTARATGRPRGLDHSPQPTTIVARNKTEKKNKKGIFVECVWKKNLPRGVNTPFEKSQLKLRVVDGSKGEGI